MGNVIDGGGGVEIVGKAVQGEVLKVSSTLADEDGLGALTYQWLRDGNAIEGAVGSSYKPISVDVGHQISVVVRYTDSFGVNTVASKNSITPSPADEPGVDFIGATRLVTSENGSSASFQVALRMRPVQDVVLTLKVSDSTEGVFASGQATTTLTFTPDIWNTPQTVTLVGVDDKPNDGDVTFLITTSVTSGDSRYNGLRSGQGTGISNLTVTNSDDDQPDEIHGDAGGVIKNDLLLGGHGASDLYGFSGKDELHGGNGDDRLFGGYGDDLLYGEEDNDELEGEQGSDKLFGDAGDDLIIGGTGKDSLYGGAGMDSLYGGDGNDLLDGSSDADFMDGGNGADTYYLDNAKDVARDSSIDTARDVVFLTSFWAGGYTLDTGIEDGVLDALAHNAMLVGNLGDNKLTGNGSDNTLNGGGGADTLTGGAGADRLTGGSGNDVFCFASLADLGLGQGRDVITDFTRGQDKIDLSLIDANLEKFGDQAFSLVTSGFGKVAGQVKYADGIVSINTDTDTAAEYEIQLIGKAPGALSALDFVL